MLLRWLLIAVLGAISLGVLTIVVGQQSVGGSTSPVYQRTSPPLLTWDAFQAMRDKMLAIKTNHSELTAMSQFILSQLNAPSTTHSNLTCPPTPQYLRRRMGCIKCSKYRRYVASCRTTGTLFMDVRLHTFLHVMESIAKWVELRQGLRILDWGSGCGTKLNYWNLKYGTVGVGVDITRPAVEWAAGHARPNQTFCWADGSKVLSLFPNSSFDRVISHSALYHVMPLSVQCKVVRHSLRIVRDGGIVWVGHLRTTQARNYWRSRPLEKCRMPQQWNVTATVMKDTRVFGGREAWYKKMGAVSVLLRKNGGAAAPYPRPTPATATLSDSSSSS
eukprot:Sspe_Gene.46575::Locus_23274_Transcript_2_2_Confidence_0.625_Length_1250::g.46575::m.46575